MSEIEEIRYVKRRMAWSHVIELGRRGVKVCPVEIPDFRDLSIKDDPRVFVFIPEEDAP